MTKAYIKKVILVPAAPPFAEIIVTIDDISFNQRFIQVINELLLTAVEYRNLQEILRQGLGNPHCRELFTALYSSW